MAKSLIIEGLKDAVRHARGDEKSHSTSRSVRVDPILNVRAIRLKLNLSQAEFARRFGFSAATVRNWEQGRRRPAGVNDKFLRVIDAIPGEVQKILAA